MWWPATFGNKGIRSDGDVRGIRKTCISMAIATYSDIQFFMRQKVVDLPELQQDISDVLIEMRGKANGKE